MERGETKIFKRGGGLGAEKSLRFRKINLLTRINTISVKDFGEGGNAMRAEFEKKETVISEKEMREFRTVFNKRNSFYMKVFLCEIQFRGEGLSTDGKEKGSKRVSLSKATARFESGGWFTINENRVLDS